MKRDDMTCMFIIALTCHFRFTIVSRSGIALVASILRAEAGSVDAGLTVHCNLCVQISSDTSDTAIEQI